MGVINSLPVNTSTIPELVSYGAVDESAKKKDLFEVAKNTGTYASPVYAAGDSRKLTQEELTGLFDFSTKREVFLVQILESAGTYPDILTDVAITSENDNDYLRLEILNRIYTDNYFNAFRLLLPVAPRNGFSFLASFDTNGTSKNNFDDYTFSSGFTYLITWSNADGKWLYDKLRNVSDTRPSYVFNNMAGRDPIPCNDAGQTYYINWELGDVVYRIGLPLLRINKSEEISFILVEDMPTSGMETFLKFCGQLDTVLAETDLVFPNTGLDHVTPPRCKKGSSWTFKAIEDYNNNTPYRIQGWFLTSEKIIL